MLTLHSAFLIPYFGAIVHQLRTSTWLWLRACRGVLSAERHVNNTSSSSLGLVAIITLITPHPHIWLRTILYLLMRTILYPPTSSNIQLLSFYLGDFDYLALAASESRGRPRRETHQQHKLQQPRPRCHYHINHSTSTPSG